MLISNEIVITIIKKGDNMSDKEELEKIAEKYKKRNQYINQWQKDKYYRLTVLIPKEQKDTITGTAKEKGFNTVSDYIKSLIDKDINGGTDQEQNSGLNDFLFM